MGKCELEGKMYKVVLIADNHFLKNEGKYYVNGTYSKQYLKRFTSNFDDLVVVARTRTANNQKEVLRMRESGGANVTFCELPDFNGVKQYLKLKKGLKKIMLKAFFNVDAVFVRMPCILTTLAFECAHEKDLPVMIDVGADPDSIYRSAKTTLFEIAISKYMKNICIKNCMTANGVSYVTANVLQKKYPCKAITNGESIEFFTESISNADISENFYCQRVYKRSAEKIKLLHISNNICKSSGKGHTEAILILKELVHRGIDATLTFIGDGDGINWLTEFADLNNVKDRVIFTGRIAGRDEYKSVILKNDIFVFPSHSEGLPRVLLETMSTGMVCVASNVDGIPEILSPEDIFNYSDIKGMADRIEEYIGNIALMNDVSNRNYNVAIKYSDVNLKVRYDSFYQKVRWLIDYRRGEKI